jgi:hypothetical protein
MSNIKHQIIIVAIVFSLTASVHAQQRASQQQQLRANAPGGGLAPDAAFELP